MRVEKIEALALQLPHLIHGSLVWISIAVHHHPIVCLVDEVGAATDVIHGGGLPLPIPHLARVGNKPDVHIVVLQRCTGVGLGTV